MLVIDFETKSMANLLVVGSDQYALTPTTDILCMCALDLETGREWTFQPLCGGPKALETMCGADLIDAINGADYIVAHNARFDQKIWEQVAVRRYGFPKVAPERWYCSSAQCRVNALPAGLDDAARAIDPRYRKDHRGSALIRECSIPPFNEDPKLLRQMAEYCLQDVRLTAFIMRVTRPLTQQEHEDWLVSERINDRGVCIDREFCEMAVQYAEQEQAEIAEMLNNLTGGEIEKHTQHHRVKKWITERLADYDPKCTEAGTDPLSLITRHKDGEKKISTDRSARATLLAAHNTDHIHLPDDVVQLLELVDDGSRSSVAKFGRMLNMADPMTDRVTGAFLYAGAGQTKRFSARGLQVHNFPRDCLNEDEFESVFDVMTREDPLDDCMNTLGRSLRCALWPDAGKVFVVGDWSGIEARALPWLSDDYRAEAVLDVFREGKDIYLHTAAGIGTDDRFIGKVATLALGYQGALGAFKTMARNYGLHLPDHEIREIVRKWRAANPWAVTMWAGLESAAKRAVSHPKEQFAAGKVSYIYTPGLLDGTLFCILPDGSCIQYARARLEDVETPFGPRSTITYLKASYSAEADATEWPRSSLYGGLLAENITQATCACLLRDCLRRLDDVCLHVHDEIVLEVDETQAEDRRAELAHVMENAAPWAADLPLKADPKIMFRYGK